MDYGKFVLMGFTPPTSGIAMYHVIRKLQVMLLSFPILFAFPTFAAAEDFSYKIIEANRLGRIQCDLTITLSKKVSQETLRQLAIELRAKECKRYDRMFITYYLAGMTVDAGAWATSHFVPDLKVHMQGLTAEQERERSTKSDKRSGRAIGVWLDEMLDKIAIRHQNGTIVLVQQFGDGSIWNKEMIERQESGRWWYIQKGENTFGEYYVIDHSGDLGVYDHKGLIRTLQPVR